MGDEQKPVRLISHSVPTEDLSGMGIGNIQDLIAYCARVSNPSNQFNTDTSKKLIKYLLKNKHWSPFEMASACLEITTTRDIARQILRHRSFSFSEFSQRYADPTKDLNFELREARLQDTSNRQNSIETEDKVLNANWMIFQQDVQEFATKAYNWAIENGIAKEQARVVLPEGNTVSKLLVNGTLRSWIHYIELRSDKGTQKEHREIARGCADVLTTVFPMITDFLNFDKEDDKTVFQVDRKELKVSEWLGL